jgi:2-desacetyl-2-hydroxyethyl bacteriochlorophyllide A dehydrogenase
MRAIRLVESGKPLELQEIEIPEVGANDVLVAVKAAGICHSDAHYRAGISPVHPLPLTLGHEVAGVVEQVGAGVTSIKEGDRVCLHYLVTCGECNYCHRGSEQFCRSGSMIGKYRDGGYAEYICIPARSVFVLPDEVPFEQGAILMCSSATSLHAINKSRLKPGESVAVFGVGGLGISAIQLAKAYGAEIVLAVDINPSKLETARRFGAEPINAREVDPVAEIRRLTGGRGVDVALELIGLSLTMQQSVQSLAILGRAAIAGLTDKSIEIWPYQEVINKEVELIGVSDHLAQEIPQLLAWARSGKLDLADVISQTIPLDADLINEVLDQLESFGQPLRVVITP